MAKDPKDILAMSDDELMLWTLSGMEGSYVHKIGETAMIMRNSIKTLKATKQLVTHTKGLAVATWGIVVITFLTQVSLIYLTATRSP